MARGERLDRGDAGDDVVLDVDVRRDRVEDPQRAVVQRRVPPRQKGSGAAVGQLGLDGVGPDSGARDVPVGDGLRGSHRPWRAGGSASATNR